MARSKEWWRAEIFGIGGIARNMETDELEVSQSFRLDRDSERFIHVMYPPDQARQIAAALIEAADKIDRGGW